MLIFEEGGNRVFRFTEFGFDLKMPLAEWNALTADQKKALVHVLENYGKSNDLTAAMQHLKSEGISGIELRYGSTPKNQDGTDAVWGDANGQPAAAQIDYDPALSDPSQRDIPPGTKVVISFNAGHAATASADGFAEVLIHELLHPYVADTTQSDGRLETMMRSGGSLLSSKRIWEAPSPQSRQHWVGWDSWAAGTPTTISVPQATTPSPAWAGTTF